MNQTNLGLDQEKPTWRRGSTTMTRTRGNIVVRIDGVPTYEDDVSGEVMIPGPLAVQIDDAMLAMLDAIEQFGTDLVPSTRRSP